MAARERERRRTRRSAHLGGATRRSLQRTQKKRGLKKTERLMRTKREEERGASERKRRRRKNKRKRRRIRGKTRGITEEKRMTKKRRFAKLKLTN